MRFGRRKDDGAFDDDLPEADGVEGDGELAAGPSLPDGPRDAEEIDLDELGPHIDLGSLLMPPVTPGTDLQLRLPLSEEFSGAELAPEDLDAQIHATEVKD